MDITKRQKKILAFTSIGIILFIISWIFVYLPVKNSVKILKVELLDVENEIDAVKSELDKDESLMKGSPALKRQLEDLDVGFPDNEEDVLRMISDTAYNSGVDVISVKPRPKTLLLDKNKKKVKRMGRVYQKMSLSITLRAAYYKLGRFLETLTEDFPFLLTIEKVGITQLQGKDFLKARVNLTMYLLSAEGK